MRKLLAILLIAPQIAFAQLPQAVQQAANQAPQIMSLIQGGATAAASAQSYIQPSLEVVKANPSGVGGAAAGVGLAIGTVGLGPVLLGTLLVVDLALGGKAIYEYFHDQQLKRDRWRALNPKEVLHALEECQSRRRVCQYGMQQNGEFIPWSPYPNVSVPRPQIPVLPGEPRPPTVYIPKNLPPSTFVAIRSEQPTPSNGKKNGNGKKTEKKEKKLSIPENLELIKAEAKRRVESVRFWVSSFRFQSGLSETQLQSMSKMTEADKEAYIKSLIPLNRLNEFYSSTHRRISTALRKEIRMAVHKGAVRELTKIVRLEMFFQQYYHHQGLPDLVERAFRSLRSRKQASPYAGSSFDLAILPERVSGDEAVFNSLIRPFRKVNEDLALEGIPLQQVLPQARYEALKKDPKIMEMEVRLGEMPEKHEAHRNLPTVTQQALKPEPREKPRLPSKIEQQRMIDEAKEKLPKLYAWKALLREARRGGEKILNASEILSVCIQDNELSTTTTIEEAEKEIGEQIIIINSNLRGNVESPANVLRGLRNIQFDLPIRIQVEAMSKTPNETAEVEAEKTIRERAREFKIKEDLPEDFEMSPKFDEQYKKIPPEKLKVINKGILMLSEWKASGNRVWKEKLLISRLGNVGRRDLWKARIDPSGGWRIVFSYVEGRAGTKIRLEEVGSHDKVTGGR